MKKIFIYFFSLIIAFNTLAADDMSLIDLFGEEENNSEDNAKKTSQPVAMPPSQTQAKAEPAPSLEEQVTGEEKKSKISEFFSFLNIPFFRTKDPAKQQELSRQEDEPQENYEQRLSRLAESGDVDASLWDICIFSAPTELKTTMKKLSNIIQLPQIKMMS